MYHCDDCEFQTTLPWGDPGAIALLTANLMTGHSNIAYETFVQCTIVYFPLQTINDKTSYLH